MHLKGLLSLAILMTTITTYSQAHSSIENEITVSRDKRIVKRDAAILIDNFPVEPIYRSDPSVVYRQITRRRYSPKPKYGPPKSIYRPSKGRKPNKKHKKPISTKYGPPNRKKRPTKPRYGPPKVSYKPVYGPPKKTPVYNYEPEEPWNYGDASANFEHTYEKPSFGEPPSGYQIPFNSASNRYVQKYKPDEYDGAQFDQEEHLDTLNNNNYNYDSGSDFNFAHTKERPVYAKPEYLDENTNEDSIDPDLLKLMNNHNPSPVYEKRRPYRKQTKKPTWRPTDSNNEADEVMVGGQYAEPPARYIPKFQPSELTYDDTDFSPMHFYMNPDRVSTMSSYVNYKNSNMAFSPQNLNDAFSIVET